MKKFLAMLLAVMMTLGMFLSVGLAEDLPRLDKADDGTIAAQAAADRIASGKVPTVVIAFMTWAGRLQGTDRVAEKMSEITMEKLGVKVELMPMDSASYAQNMNLMLASGEQVDLFNAVSVGFMPCYNPSLTESE